MSVEKRQMLIFVIVMLENLWNTLSGKLLFCNKLTQNFLFI